MAHIIGEIGKYKVLLDEVTSTQTYALELLRTSAAGHGTMVTCLHQTQGKGRLDKSWQSARNQNFAASFIVKNNLAPDLFHPGHISKVVALAVQQTLQSFLPDEVWIKWPNDIISASKKLAGILITNQWRGTHMESSVLGIGINVNQLDFKEYHQAGSIKTVKQAAVSIHEVSKMVITQLNYWYDLFLEHRLTDIHKAYLQHLYGYHQLIDLLIVKDGSTARGIIKEVQPDGKVNIEFINQSSGIYDLDEIKILF